MQTTKEDRNEMRRRIAVGRLTHPQDALALLSDADECEQLRGAKELWAETAKVQIEHHKSSAEWSINRAKALVQQERASRQSAEAEVERLSRIVTECVAEDESLVNRAEAAEAERDTLRQELKDAANSANISYAQGLDDGREEAIEEREKLRLRCEAIEAEKHRLTLYWKEQDNAALQVCAERNSANAKVDALRRLLDVAVGALRFYAGDGVARHYELGTKARDFLAQIEKEMPK